MDGITHTKTCLYENKFFWLHGDIKCVLHGLKIPLFSLLSLWCVGGSKNEGYILLNI